MNDPLTYEKILMGVRRMCGKRGISRVNKLVVIVNKRSGITSESLRMYFIMRQFTPMDESTVIEIKTEEIGVLKAIIQQLEGESIQA